jgi:hypothetical protein
MSAPCPWPSHLDVLIAVGTSDIQIVVEIKTP